MNKEKIPYLVENKERDTFTFYIKGTKPYLDLEKKLAQLTNNWNELEEWLKEGTEELPYIKGDMYWREACENVLDKMNEIKGDNNE